MRRPRPTHATALALALGLATLTVAQAPAAAAQTLDTVDVLLVVAHPDDEAMFAATVYKITHTLKGNVDLALVTDGGGGFRYAQLAEPLYGLELTDERIARHHLPAIRKQELMAGGRIIGLRNYFFLDQPDPEYTESVDTVLNHAWATAQVRSRLHEIMKRGGYDFVFAHLPIPNFHAHHKAATILALEAAAELSPAQRPVVLGSFVGSRDDSTAFFREFSEHPGYPITRVTASQPSFTFDRLQPLSPDGRLNYQIVVNWLIAEHKTQGTMQLLINRGDLERFWLFQMNGDEGAARAEALFRRLEPPAPSEPPE